MLVFKMFPMATFVEDLCSNISPKIPIFKDTAKKGFYFMWCTKGISTTIAPKKDCYHIRSETLY